MPREVFENDSKDFISDIKVSVDVTLATDDDKRLKAHNKEFTNQSALNFKIKTSLITIKIVEKPR